MRFHSYLKEDTAEDVLDIDKKVMLKHKGITFLDTYHGHERIQQRNTLKQAELKDLFTTIIDKFIKMKKHVGEHIVFWSRKLKQAVIVGVDARDTLALVTFYPRHEKPNSRTHPFQKEVVLEGKTYTYVEID
jgi:hypothetical protein